MESNKRPENMARIETPEQAQAFIAEQVAAVQNQVGNKKVLLALSGGVDSSVVAALLIRAIGQNLVCVHVNHGLLRKVNRTGRRGIPSPDECQPYLCRCGRSFSR